MSSSAPAVDLAPAFDLSSLNGSNGFVLNGIDEFDLQWRFRVLRRRM